MAVGRRAAGAAGRGGMGARLAGIAVEGVRAGGASPSRYVEPFPSLLIVWNRGPKP